jgi:methyltransferase (TIGR00027 family)
MNIFKCKNICDVQIPLFRKCGKFLLPRQFASNLPLKLTEVQSTALYTCFWRMCDLEQSVDPLSNDYLAKILVNKLMKDDLRNSLTRSQLLTSGVNILAARTKFLDDLIVKECLENNIRQLVILGAGMDTRVYRIPELQNQKMTVYEVDSDIHVLQTKHALLREQIDPNCTLSLVRADISNIHETKELLLRAGFNRNQPSLFIAEGLMEYIKPDLHTFIFQGIASLDLKSKSTFAMQCLSPSWHEYVEKELGETLPYEELYHPKVMMDNLHIGGWKNSKLYEQSELVNMYKINKYRVPHEGFNMIVSKKL